MGFAAPPPAPAEVSQGTPPRPPSPGFGEGEYRGKTSRLSPSTPLPVSGGAGGGVLRDIPHDLPPPLPPRRRPARRHHVRARAVAAAAHGAARGAAGGVAQRGRAQRRRAAGQDPRTAAAPPRRRRPRRAGRARRPVRLRHRARRGAAAAGEGAARPARPEGLLRLGRRLALGDGDPPKYGVEPGSSPPTPRELVDKRDRLRRTLAAGLDDPVRLARAADRAGQGAEADRRDRPRLAQDAHPDRPRPRPVARRAASGSCCPGPRAALAVRLPHRVCRRPGAAPAHRQGAAGVQPPQPRGFGWRDHRCSPPWRSPSSSAC